MLQPVWIVSTPFGNAVRTSNDVERADESTVWFGSPSAVIASAVSRVSLSVSFYAPSDLPDMRRTKTEISNVCGFVAGGSVHSDCWRIV